jgi:galactofuranose transport system permease protein
LPKQAKGASSLAAHGLALLLGHNDSVAIASDTSFATFGQGDWLGMPIPGLLAGAVTVAGCVALARLRFGRHTLAIGGSEEASRLMGLKVDRTLVAVYAVSGLLARLGVVDLVIAGDRCPPASR